MKVLNAVLGALLLLPLVSCDRNGVEQDVSAPAESAGPFNGAEVTQADVDAALERAKAEKKFLMVEFGADWCGDCLVLARTLSEGETKKYFEENFVVLKVDVGRFDRNREITKAVGVQLNAIPTAAFFGPDGQPVGATNKMELEPSSRYGTRQILPFLKQIAENRSITNPAQYQ